MLLQRKEKWKIFEAVNLQESCKHWVLMWKSCAQSELVKEWRSPPFCRNFQSGTRSLHAHRYHCCSRLCTNQRRVCSVHIVKQQKIAHTYHYRKGACCTCSATTTPITPYCAQSTIPSLHIVHIKAKVHTDTNTKRKHTHINAKKGAMRMHVITAIPWNVYSSMHKCVHCFKTQKAHHALSMHKRRPCRATSNCYHRLS